jgi:predicted MPP superfamily phosphohydrolase
MRLNDFFSIAAVLSTVFFVCGFEIYFLIRALKRAVKRKTGPSRWPIWFSRAIHLFFYIGLACYLYSYFVEPYWLQASRLIIHTDKLKNTNLRIIHITDLHCDTKMRNERRLSSLINSLKPDIVVFTGDTINSQEALPLFKSFMKSIQCPIKYAVLGNVDEWYWRGLDLFSGTGFQVLNKDCVRLTKNKEKFSICGLNYSRPDRLNQALSGSIPSDFRILLYHTPDLIGPAAQSGIDLYLCGHTHGGQVRLPFYGAIVTFSGYGKKYESGKYRLGNTIIYVNRGVGMEKHAPRIRFLCRPEFLVIDVKPDKKN